jgi:putative PIN family toxin of toxin-antitoxin system
MRIVLDTNVLVSGLLNPNGVPGRVIDLILGRQIQLLYDDRILNEYHEVLSRPKLRISKDHAIAVLNFFRIAGEPVTALPLPAELLTDLGDLPFAEVAASGNADALVTGNSKHFTGLDKHGITVLSPAMLIKRLTP